jgi:geranylgeranyl diphosphate synthase, type I
MDNKIKNRLDIEIGRFTKEMEKLYSLEAISPFLSMRIREFISREGKRVRPILYIIAYLGFAEKPAQGLYRSAISIELLHDFMLIHDDIIDKSDTRRGKPSMHKLFDLDLEKHRGLKFSGEDLAIVAGDVLYAMSLHVFLSIQEEPSRKEAALKKIMKAALYTGSGEFLELINGITDIDKLTLEDIYKVYDLKTANYTFASPLAVGATLGGADNEEINKLFKYGIYTGRAFQIKDDIIGLYEEEKTLGKPNLSDIREAKKTILVWYAYKSSRPEGKAAIKAIFSKKNAGQADLLQMRRIVKESGALDYAKTQIAQLQNNAQNLLKLSAIKPRYKQLLTGYSQEILKSHEDKPG